MSSWLIMKNIQQKKKVQVSKYHDTSSSEDVFTMYLELLASFIYSQKMGETCNVWDTTNLVKDTLKVNPQLRILREKPETESQQLSEYNSILYNTPFKESQKIAANLISYNPTLNQTVVKFLEKAGIKSMFDIGIHLVKDPAGPDLPLLKRYVSLIKNYQAKSKKDTLTVYIMSDNYSTVQHFQTICDASWKITSLSKTPLKSTDDMFVQAMAEVQIMTALPALILDFERPVDRFIYLMQRSSKLTYFVELGDNEWKFF